MSEVNSSVAAPQPARSRRRWVLLGLALALLVVIYALQRTPSLAVSQPTALKLLPAPTAAASYWGAERIPDLRKLLSTMPWSDVLSGDLLKQFLARGAAPAGLAPTASTMESFAFRWLLSSLASDAGILRNGSDALAVARLGLSGRVGYNVFRWLGRRARRATYSSTPGVAVLSSTGKPRLHLAMRGPYLFASPSERALSAALTLAEGSSAAASLAGALPVTAEDNGPRFLRATLAPGSRPRLITAVLDRGGARALYRYALQEPVPALPPAALLEAARTVPKESAVYVSAAWPPAVLASLSPESQKLRDHLWQWFSQGEAEEASDVLRSEIQRPVSLAAGDWIEVPNHVPFPHLVATARAEDGASALGALDRILRLSLEQDFTRVELSDRPGALVFRNEGRLGELGPSAARKEDQLLLASSEQFLREALASAEGLAPCLADRPEFAGLGEFAGQEQAAALVFTTGADMARLGSDLFLQLAARLSPTAGADARDLLAPAVKRLDRFAGVYGRLSTESDGKTGRFELRLNFASAR